MRHPGLYKLPIGDREKKDNLGISEAKFAPSPSRPVEARAPAHRYVALALGWRVSVLEGEIVVKEGTLAANLLSQGRAAGTGPR